MSRVIENQIGTVVVDCAVEIHRRLGPGLFESVYEVILAEVLSKRGLIVHRQVAIPVDYDGIVLAEAFRADIIVADTVLIEVKSVERLAPVHRKQVQTYLRLSKLRLGFILNFGAPLMKDGIVRCVNGLPE